LDQQESMDELEHVELLDHQVAQELLDQLD